MNKYRVILSSIGMSKKHNSGYTLLEVVITLSIVVLILAAMYSVLVTTVTAQQKMEELWESTSIAPSILVQIIQDLESLTIPDNDKAYFLGVDGQDSVRDTDRIDFISTTLAISTEESKPKFSTLNEIGYILKRNERDPSFYVLYRRHQTNVDDEPLKGGHLQEIYDKVVGLNLKYYDGKEWQNSWDSKEKKGLPDALRIDLTLPSKDADIPEQPFTTIFSFVK